MIDMFINWFVENIYLIIIGSGLVLIAFAMIFGD